MRNSMHLPRDCKIFLLFLITLTLTYGLKALPDADSLKRVSDSLQGKLKIAALNNLAEVLLQSDLDEAVKTAGLAIKFEESESYTEEKARAQRIIADALFYKTEYLQAIHYYHASAETEKELHGELSDNYLQRLNDIGFCYNELAIYDKAIEYYKMSLEIARKVNNREEIATNLNNIGNSLFAMGEYAEAIPYFDSTLQIDREAQNDEHISIDLNNFGKVYFSWGKYQKALEYYFESLTKAEAAGNEHMQAIRHSNIGQVYLKLEDYENARKHFNTALAIDRRLGNHGKLGIRYSNLGLLNLQLGNYDTAQVYFMDAVRIFETQNMLPSSVINLNNLGDLMRKKNDFDRALEYYQQSLSLSEKAGIKPEAMRSLHSIAEIYRLSGNYRNTVDYLLRYSSLKDTIFNEEKHRQLAEFEARYEIEKKERENLLLKNKARIYRNQKIIFIISGSALLMITLVLLMLLSIKRKSLQQSKLIYEKDNQLHQLDLEKKEKENQYLQDVLFAEEQINRLQT
ncbi:MAG TPA: tetratricopeptide repeat protein, partial [Bacteroidales bacterium]|nr:tetratricopeptide repeat protein [Bacteroidales bacterium]